MTGVEQGGKAEGKHDSQSSTLGFQLDDEEAKEERKQSVASDLHVQRKADDMDITLMYEE